MIWEDKFLSLQKMENHSNNQPEGKNSISPFGANGQSVIKIVQGNR
jgi:hypothetical protein